MRHLILALMIALLPLRGWVGDAMATDMVSGTVAAAGTHASASYGQAAGAEADTHDHMTMDSPEHMTMPDCSGHGALAGSAQDKASHDDHCGSCDSCQTCHTVALFDGARTSASPWPTPMAPASIEARFISADAALNQKPPIS